MHTTLLDGMRYPYRRSEVGAPGNTIVDRLAAAAAAF